MTRAEFQRYVDELRGLILSAYEDQAATRGDYHAKGLAFTQTLGRVTSFAERLWQAIEAKPLPTNGQPQRQTTEVRK